VIGSRLAADPPVLVMWDYVFHKSVANRPDFWATLKGRPTLIILLRSWEIRNALHAYPWQQFLAEHRSKFPQHRVVYAVNEPSQLPILAAAGIEGVWCSHNAFVDERVFQPATDAHAGEAREFDAIYDARIARFKRHELAARVRQLALIHYTSPEWCEPLWLAMTRWRLRHSRILNRQRWGLWPVWLTHAEVAAANNRARVGLCLSAVEGAMVASIQYLLCGLPVVTTPNRGGRSVFFDADNSVEVAPEPEAVAAGVRAMIARRLDPWAIRAQTLVRMAEHRARLIALVRDFQRGHGVPGEKCLAIEWPGQMGNVFKDRLA
jgi:glycosyltransferase involved in cell wall biosynthesis